MSNLMLGTVAVVLLAYWFHRNCLAILNTKFGRDYAGQVARANQLSFLDIQYRLRSDHELEPLDALYDSLARDFRILTYLLSHTAEFQVGARKLNHRMLLLYFRILQVWFAATRRLHPPQARRALGEMSLVLNHFANRMGQRTATSTAGMSRV